AAEADEGAYFFLDFTGDRLDPAPLVALLPLTTVRRPKKKGDPLGPTREGKTPRAKTGYCGFHTHDIVPSKTANEHAKFLLEFVSDHLSGIRSIMSAQSLAWKAVLAEGPLEGQRFSDLEPEIFRKADELGLPLSFENAIIVTPDVGRSEP
ncbi:MAG: hypothetical protein ACREF1_11075, partial [Acetobacteraceae bacterium]